MNKILIKAFLSGWFDPLEKRLAYMAAYDAAINNRPVTQRVVTMSENCWGML